MSEAVVSVRGRLLPASKAAKRMGISIHVLRRRIDANRIAHVRDDSGRLLGLYERDCDEWVSEHRRTPAQHVERAAAARQDVDERMNRLITRPRRFGT